MRIGGVDPKSLPVEEILVLPRGDKEIVFRATGVSSYEEFIAAFPEPKVPLKRTREGIEEDRENPDFKSTQDAYNRKRLAYIVVKSLAPSEIEWDTVKPDVPATWSNWDADLKAAGLSQHECNLVTGVVLAANSLDEGKLKKARELFLQGPPLSPVS